MNVIAPTAPTTESHTAGRPNGEFTRLLQQVPIIRRKVEQGAALFHAGDTGESAQLVLSGLVGLEVGARHREPVIARLYRPGDLTAVGRLISPGSIHEGTGRALADTEVQLLRWRDIEDPRIAEKMRAALVNWMAYDTRMLLQRLVEAAHVPARGKVAAAILRLADDADEICLSQEVIASVAGVVRPTANTELSALAAKGVVKLARRRVTIVDRPTLARFAR